MLSNMERILIIGSPGSGKSTFAIELGKKTGLPVIHLDHEFWNPGWAMTPRELWLERTHDMIERDRWIIDGTYDSSLHIRLPRADTVVFLDFPRYLCLWRILKRIILNFSRVRPDMGEGCPDKIDFEFFKWVWNYRRDRYPNIKKCLRENFSAGNLVVVESPQTLRQYLNKFD